MYSDSVFNDILEPIFKGKDISFEKVVERYVIKEILQIFHLDLEQELPDRVVLDDEFEKAYEDARKRLLEFLKNPVVTDEMAEKAYEENIEKTENEMERSRRNEHDIAIKLETLFDITRRLNAHTESIDKFKSGLMEYISNRIDNQRNFIEFLIKERKIENKEEWIEKYKKEFQSNLINEYKRCKDRYEGAMNVVSKINTCLDEFRNFLGMKPNGVVAIYDYTEQEGGMDYTIKINSKSK